MVRAEGLLAFAQERRGATGDPSTAVENPKWNENAPSKRRAGFGQLQPTDEGKIKPQGTAGRLGFECNFKHASNIVKTWRDLLSSPSRCSCSAFHALRGHDEGKRRFHVRPGRIPSTRAPETKSFLAQALTSTQKAGRSEVAAPGAAAGSDAVARITDDGLSPLMRTTAGFPNMRCC
jgi:hypothetical protein